jgi:hypothetical protein
MFGKNSVFVVLGLAGLACGFGMRWLALPKAGGGVAVDEVDVSGVPVVSEAGEVLIAMPTLDDIGSVEGAVQRRLLIRYLRGAKIGDVEALILAMREESLKGLDGQKNLIYVRALELDGVEFVAWIKKIDSENVRLRYSLASIYSIWMKVDLEAALAASASEEEYVRKSVIRALAVVDLERAVALAKAEWPGDPMVEELENIRMKKLAEEDPMDALTKKMETVPKHKMVSSLSPLLFNWAKKDPQAAWQWLSEQKGLDPSNRLARDVILAMAEMDPVGAREKLALLPENTGRMKIEGELVAKLSESDMEGAMQTILGEKNERRRDYLFSKIAAKLLADDPKRLLQFVRENGISLGDNLVESWSMDARGHGWSHSGGDEISDLVGKATIELAREDPRGALLNLASLDPNKMSGTIKSVSKLWAATDARGAADWAASLPEGAFRGSIQGAIVDAWITTESSDALNWLADKSPDSVPYTLETLSRREPAIAAKFVDLIASSEQRSDGIKKIAHNWRRSDPEGATQWLGGIADSNDVSTMLQDAARDWVLKKPEEASSWISEMKAGIGKDNAVAGMVNALMASSNPQVDFEAASVWAGTIGDEAMRVKWEQEITSRRAKEETANGH